MEKRDTTALWTKIESSLGESFKVLDGDRDEIVVRSCDTGKEYAIRIQKKDQKKENSGNGI